MHYRMGVNAPVDQRAPVSRMLLYAGVYLAANVASIFMPFIPGTGTVVVWCLLAPVSAITAVWIWFAGSGRRHSGALSAAVILTALFAGLSVVTLVICSRISASI